MHAYLARMEHETGDFMSQFFALHPDNPQARLLRKAVSIIEEGGLSFTRQILAMLWAVVWAINQPWSVFAVYVNWISIII